MAVVTAGGYEITFVVDVDRGTAWKALTAEPGQLPGFLAPIDDLTVEDGRSLRGRKGAEPCKGTEISITLEDAGTGTRVTVTQSGFPAWFDVDLEAHAIGWSCIVADLALALERGVAGGRYPRPWSSLGASVRALPAGLEVTTVQGGCAAAAGLQPGDLLLTVGGAPVVVERELHTVLRVFRPGQEVKVSWVRAGERMSAAAAL